MNTLNVGEGRALQGIFVCMQLYSQIQLNHQLIKKKREQGVKTSV